MIDNLGSFCDAMGWLGLFGLGYWLARGRKRSPVPLGLLVAIGVTLASLVVTLMIFGRSSGRYYRVPAPMLFILAGGGLHALWEDMESHSAIRGVAFSLLVVLCLGAIVYKPIRGHREPQTEAGLWLRKHDPEYNGFVLSSYTQPVYYAGMRYLPSDKYGSRRVFRQLTRAGYWPRYVILDGDDAEEMPWLGELVRRPVWKLVHSEPERDIRIFEHTVRRRLPPYRPTEAD